MQRTMLELLNQLDGFDSTPNVKIIMATNRIDILDPALLRPGRIDRKIEFPHPNLDSRVEILRIHSRKMNAAEISSGLVSHVIYRFKRLILIDLHAVSCNSILIFL